MSRGRGTGLGGIPTPGRSTGPRRSRPGTTPGSTPPARSGPLTGRPGRCPGCRYAEGVLRTRTGQTAALRILTERDRDEALALCDRDAVANVFVSARIYASGLDPMQLSAQVWGFHEAGRLVSLCYVGANMIPVEAVPAAIAAFAPRAPKQGPRCSSIAAPAPPLPHPSPPPPPYSHPP